MSFDVRIILDNVPLFLQGAWITLWLTFLAFVFGMAIGALAALAIFSPLPPLRWLVNGYIALLRSIPFIVLMFLIHFGLPAAGIRAPALISGTASLALFAGAYYTEVIRACVQALPRGQWESARAIGLSPLSALRYIVVPQIWAPMLPPVVNCTITMIKESAVLSSITVTELTFSGLVVQGNTFAPFEVFVAVALLYWSITSVFAWAAHIAERRERRDRRRLTPLVGRYLVLDGERAR